MPATRQGTTYNNGNMPGKGRRNRNRQSNPSSRTSSESEGTVDRTNAGNVTPATPSTSQAGSSTTAVTMTTRPVKTEPTTEVLDLVKSLTEQMRDLQTHHQQFSRDTEVRFQSAFQQNTGRRDDIFFEQKASLSIPMFDSTSHPRPWFTTVERVASMSNCDPMKLAILRTPPDIQNRIAHASSWTDAKNEICMTTGHPPDEVVNLAIVKQEKDECFYNFFNRARDLTGQYTFSIAEMNIIAGNIREPDLRAEAIAMLMYNKPSSQEFSREITRIEAVMKLKKNPTETPAVNNVGRFSRRDNFDHNNRYGNNRPFNRSQSRGRYNNRDSSQGRTNNYNSGQQNGYNSGQQNGHNGGQQGNYNNGHQGNYNGGQQNSYNGGQQNNYQGNQQNSYNRDSSQGRQNNYNRDNSRGRQGSYSRDGSRNRQDNRYGNNSTNSNNGQPQGPPPNFDWKAFTERQEKMMKAIEELQRKTSSLN